MGSADDRLDGLGPDLGAGAELLSQELAFRPKTGMTDGTQANRMLSEALGLAEPHAYREKSRACLAILRGALRK